MLKFKNILKREKSNEETPADVEPNPPTLASQEFQKMAEHWRKSTLQANIELGKLWEEKSQWLNEKERKQAAIKELMDELKREQEEKRELASQMKKFDELQEHNEKLENEVLALQSMRAENSALQTELTRLRMIYADNARLTGEVAALPYIRIELQRVQDELKKSKQENGQLRSVKVPRLESKICSLENVKRALVVKQAELFTALQKKILEVERMRATTEELSKAQATVEHLSLKLLKSEDDNIRLKKEIASLTEENAQIPFLTSKVESLEKERENKVLDSAMTTEKNDELQPIDSLDEMDVSSQQTENKNFDKDNASILVKSEKAPHLDREVCQALIESKL